MNELALFAGAGGGILAARILGIHTVAACELDPAARSILLARQRDGILPHFPIWDDIRTFDGAPWRGRIGIIPGGFPCQDISIAGKGAGLAGPRSGLWSEMHRIICEVRPHYVFMENSPILISRGLGHILADLAASGYHAAWFMLGAADCGAPHKRKRIWILARNPDIPDPDMSGREKQRQPKPEAPPHTAPQRGMWWATEPRVCRVVDGLAHRVDRLRALGNGQVPLVAATAFTTLRNLLNHHAPEPHHPPAPGS